MQMGQVVKSLLPWLDTSVYSNSVTAELEGSTQAIPKPAMWRKTEPVSSTAYPHDPLPKDTPY